MATSIDVLKIDSMNPFLTPADDTLASFPEFKFFEASAVPNLSFKGLRIAADSGQAVFRTLNTGKTWVAPNLVEIPIECKAVDASWKLDVLSNSYRGQEFVFSIAASTALKSAFAKYFTQLWAGTDATLGGDANGFDGLTSFIDSSHTIGTDTPDDEKKFRIFAVNTSPEAVQLCWGNGGQVDVSEIYRSTTDTSATAGYHTFAQAVCCWGAVQAQSLESAALAYVLESEMSDARLYELLETFKAGFEPVPIGGNDAKPKGAFFMSKGALSRLRASRTATNERGVPAPYPTEVQGIPIFTSGCLFDIAAE